MKSQELEHLRNELNMHLKYLSEHTNKTINTILLIWSGILTVSSILPKFEYVKLLPLCTVVATIIIISNIVLYCMNLKRQEIINAMAKLSAYIAVFYEKRPQRQCMLHNKIVKNADNIFWELVNFEIATRPKEKKSKTFLENDIYEILSLIPTVLIGIIMIVEFFVYFEELCTFNMGIGIFACCMKLNIFNVISFVLCVSYFMLSIYLYHKTKKSINTSLKGSKNDIKTKHLKRFIEYSHKTGYYTKKELEDRFGNLMT